MSLNLSKLGNVIFLGVKDPKKKKNIVGSNVIGTLYISKMMVCETRTRREISRKSCVFLVQMCLLPGKCYVPINSKDYFYKLTLKFIHLHTLV